MPPDPPSVCILHTLHYRCLPNLKYVPPPLMHLSTFQPATVKKLPRLRFYSVDIVDEFLLATDTA